MFGYVRPFKPELLVKDFDLYKSVYCGLCSRLGKDYGVVARLILSYDSTFLAMVCAGLNKDGCGANFIKKHCTCNPFKKCTYCSFKDDSLEFSAAFSVISCYYKLSDTVTDENFLKSTTARFLRFCIKGKRNKAARKYSELDRIVSDMMLSQTEAENREFCSIDRAADSTAKMLSEIMQIVAEKNRIADSEKDFFTRFGYFLGRWIYLIDAVDDFDRDKKQGSFNPVVNKFSNIPNCTLKNEDVKLYCNGLLNQTSAMLVSEYEHIELTYFKNIIDNIIYKGMPEIQRRVIFDRPDSRKRL